MKYSKDKIYIFTTGNKARQFKNITVANNVINRCVELTGNMNIEHRATYCDEQTWHNVFDKIEYYLKNKIINVIYTGLTADPPQPVLDTFLSKPTQTKYRDPAVARDVLKWNGTSYTPWTNIDKKKIAQIYKEYNLIDNLFVHTRSCEWQNKGEDPGLGHCGICWWCQERNWGFDLNNSIL